MIALWHGAEATAARGLGDYVGSPMYDVIPEHGPGLLAVAVLGLAAWLVRRRARRGGPWATPFVADYRHLPVRHRLLAWLLLLSAAVHLGLVLGHEPSGYSVGYAALGATGLWVATRLIKGQRWRGYAAGLLAASLLGYAVSSISGEAPVPLGLATKVFELTALAFVLAPRGQTRPRRLGASTTTVVFAVIVAIGAWGGAFSAGEGGHHLGEVPPPGVLVPAGEDRDPTPEERHEADELYAATVAAVAKYQDPEVARADGFDVDGIYGLDFHASNEAYKNDNHILDPEYPETLIYAADDGDPVLVGVMYEADDIGTAGPAIGGPLTVWHAHDHVCFSFTPPALAGLTSPFGTCPVASITVPITNEMIHVWTLPGAPERFGDLEEAWLEDYLARR